MMYRLIKKMLPLIFTLIKWAFLTMIVAAICGIIVICISTITSFIVGTTRGIFFSDENMSDVGMKQVVQKLNKEMADKINYIKSNNIYDEYKIISNKANWKEILSIYSVKISNNNQREVVTIDDGKIEELSNIFWTMNTIEYEIVEENLSEDYQYDNTELKKVLYIYIDSKSIDEMSLLYNFSDEQRHEVDDLLSDYYNDMWAALIYGVPINNSNDIVSIALTQVGNVGGEPYWSWYGFESRVEWCAIFVSWVMNQAGIDEKIMPKFSVVSTGVNWFKATGAWHESEYIPSSGDIIFFDWGNGKPSHVGIVERIDRLYVYTIEGNSNGDTCRQKKYSLDSSVIYGYGSLYQ